MKAVMKVDTGVGHVELRDIAEPAPGPGQVLIRVKAAGICGTDLHIYHDEFKTVPPVVLGHEVAGEIAALGPGVSGLKEGKRVTTETYFSTCGSCRYCRDGQYQPLPVAQVYRFGGQRRIHPICSRAGDQHPRPARHSRF